MGNKKEYGDGAFFKFGNHVYWLFMLNFYFLVTNIVFLFFVVTLERTFSNISLYFLSLIPTGPSISALFYSLGKMVKEKDLSPTKDFFQGYKKNFKDSLKIWIPFLLVQFILLVDLKYFQQSESYFSSLLSFFFLFIVFMVFVIVIYAVQINVFFVFRLRDIFKLSVFYVIRKLKNTLGNIAILFITIFIVYVTSDLFLLFIAGPVSYVIYINSKEILEDIQINFTESE